MNDSSIQALNIAQISFDVTANNIANISTDDFFSSSVDVETEKEGYGVQIADTVNYQTDIFWLDVVNHISEDRLINSTQVINNNIDLSHEIVDLIIIENYFSANAQVLKTGQDINHVLLDMIV